MKSRRSVNRWLAVALMAAVAACQDGATPTGVPSPAPDLSRVPAQDRLEALFRRSSPEVMALPGTIFADNDETTGKLVFGVEHLQAAFGVQTALARLGVAESDYSIELTQPIHFVATLREEVRPIVAGLQIHFSRFLCSIGFNVTHGSPTTHSMITASHCTAKQGGVEGTLYYQPTRSVNGTPIATEVSDPLYLKGGTDCPRGRKCRYSDAARAEFAAGVSVTDGEIAKTSGANNASLTISGAFSVTGQDNGAPDYVVGTVVNKVGRTTGWTSGLVDRTCVNTNVLGTNVHLLCQTFVTSSSAIVGGGDSGSGVFTITSGSNVTAVGVLWGGTSDNKTFVFSPLGQVQQELGSLTFTK